MHFENQPGACDACDLGGGPDVIGIGRRGDDDIRAHGGEFMRHAAHFRRELQHVEQPLGAVAGVWAGAQPDIVDAVDVFAGHPGGRLGVVLAQVGDAAGNDGDAVALPHPFPGQIVWPELHAMSWRAGVVVDEQDIHGCIVARRRAGHCAAPLVAPRLGGISSVRRAARQRSGPGSLRPGPGASAGS